MNAGRYSEILKREPALMAYLDLSNMFHWQDILGWKFRIEDVISSLRAPSNVKEVKVYYGLNERDRVQSESFHRRIRKTGAILKTKPVKYIRKTINEAFFFKRATMTLFDGGMMKSIYALIEEIRRAGVLIEELKCNFDVEMAMDDD